MFNSKGYTIIEALIVVGVLGFIAIGVLNLQSAVRAIESSARQNVDAAALVRGVSQVLLDSQSCTGTFSGKNPTGSSGASVDDIKKHDSGEGSSSVYLDVYSKEGEYFNKSLKLKEIKIRNFRPVQSNDEGIATVDVHMSKEGLPSYLGGKNLMRSFSLFVKRNSSGTIASCYAQTDASAESSCNEMGGELENGVCVKLKTADEVTFEGPLDVKKKIQIDGVTSVSGTLNTKQLSMPVTDTAPNPRIDVQRATVTTGGTAKVTVANKLSAKNVNVVGSIKTKTASAPQICIAGQCRNFAAHSCPSGEHVEIVYANGSIKCKGVSSTPGGGGK